MTTNELSTAPIERKCSNSDCRSEGVHEHELLLCEGVEDTGQDCGVAACEECQWHLFRFAIIAYLENEAFLSPRCDDCYDKCHTD